MGRRLECCAPFVCSASTRFDSHTVSWCSAVSSRETAQPQISRNVFLQRIWRHQRLRPPENCFWGRNCSSLPLLLIPFEHLAPHRVICSGLDSSLISQCLTQFFCPHVPWAGHLRDCFSAWPSGVASLQLPAFLLKYDCVRRVSVASCFCF